MSVLHTIIGLLLLGACAHAAGDDREPFALRNHHPLLHVYGLPPFQSASLAAPGSFDYRLSLTVVNNAEIGASPPEVIELDGETWFADLSIRRRIAGRLELGLDLPLVRHSGGILDSTIEGWHDLLGLSNSKRGGPDNQLDYHYEDGGAVVHDVSSSSFGLGDVQLTAAIPLLSGNAPPGRHVALRFSVKLPTGDPDELRGSGATDAALGIYAQTAMQALGQDFALFGFAGALAMGDGELFPGRQRSTVPFGGAAITWNASDRFGVAAQLQAQGSYVDSALEDLGESTLQFALGAIYRSPRSGLSLRFAVIEDVARDATPDFALHFGVHVAGGD